MSKNIELPKSWARPKLSDIAKINPKLPFEIENQNLEVSFLPMKLVEAVSNKIHLTENKQYSEVKKGFTPMIDHDVIFAKITPCMENGKIAVVNSLKNGIGFGSTEFHVFRTNAACNNKYLFYWLVQDQTRIIAAKNMRGAVGQRRVPKEFLEEYHIHLPPINEQQRIVSKIEELFSSLDKGIESLKLAQQQLKVYRQAVLKWAFEGKLGSTKLTQFVTRRNVKVLDIAESLDNLRKPVNKSERSKRVGTIPYYGANGRTGWIDDFIFDEPLILVVEDETFIGRVLPFSYKVTGKSWVNNHAHILRPKKTTNIDFLNYQLQFYPFLPLTTGTTGRKKLTKHALMNAPVCTFSPQEQQIIVLEIESRLSICDKIEESIEQSLQQAEALRQSILKKAFEGKLIPQDPNDEPASVLLERIHAEYQKAAQPGKTKKAKKSRQTELVFETV